MQTTSALSNLRSWLTYGNRSKWLVFILFSLTLFIKTMVFHWTTMHSILFSSLWKAPLAFFAFWGSKLVPVLFLSAFVFITKRQYWTIVINLLLDIWCIANLFYVKANGFFLTFDMIFMASNMDGFWSSLQAYMGWDIIVFPILTILYTSLFYLLNILITSKRNMIIGVLLIALSFLWASMNVFLHQKAEYDAYSKAEQSVISIWMKSSTQIQYQYCFPFGSIFLDANINAWMDESGWSRKYLKSESIISFMPAIIIYKILNTQSPANTLIDLSEQKEFIGKFLKTEPKQVISQNVVFILVESLESWVIDILNDTIISPNLVKLKNSNHVCMADKVICQTKYGNSADGQMIGMTGLLPISSGATSKLYGKNEFPNFAHMYPNSAIVNPSVGAWQQATMTQSYEFQDLIEPEIGEVWRDEDVINQMLEYSFNRDTTFCILGITITSHTPFLYGVENQKYTFEDMPQIMSAYLNCLHYTDSCIGILVDSILNSPLANNTTIVITGDHTIFRDANTFSDMTEYAQANDINFQAGKTFTPLIIYSPNIQGNIHVTDTCYQMDIFPTILHLIGAEDYYWKGFGVNLLDSTARNNRPITEQEAYRLSDLMIRTDYFRHYCADTDSTNIAEYYL